MRRNQRWALPLVLLAFAVLAGSMMLSAMLFPDQSTSRTYRWPAADTATLRRVVVAPAVGRGVQTQLEWSDDAALEITANENQSFEPALVLRQQGDTLYIDQRLPVPASNERRHRQIRHLTLRLPMQVHQIEADEISLHESAPMRLALQGRRVNVNLAGLHRNIEHLRITGLNDGCELLASWRGPRLTVRAGQVHQLQIETLSGHVELNDFGGVDVVTLHSPPETTLLVDKVGDLPKLQWHALSSERSAALNELSRQRAAASVGTASDDDHACPSPDIRMKRSPAMN
ncbi:hypothetical protein [Ottowia sp.]|uniref:hypothetical protein n=1 Tax=Ottowia sp. TaxID=1898956 RepID=UPI003A840953